MDTLTDGSARPIAVLGGGVMGGTVISALVEAEVGRVVVAEKDPDRAAELVSTFGVEAAEAPEAVRHARIVFVVVKPFDVVPLVSEIAEHLASDVVVVSLAAGVRCASIESVLPTGAGVIRVMPNTPAVIGKGVFAISSGAASTEEQLQQVIALLAVAGDVVVVDESKQDAVTAVSGSGPAYVFYLAEQMITAGIEAGLAPDVARQLVVDTLVGSSELLAQSDDSPEDLRRRVTSPNGTTHAAITVFDSTGVGVGLRAGIAAAAHRSVELSGGPQ